MKKKSSYACETFWSMKNKGLILLFKNLLDSGLHLCDELISVFYVNTMLDLQWPEFHALIPNYIECLGW